jgi:tetratricopeptide (TPR) repeat protein
LGSMSNLAELYRSQGKYTEAEPLSMKCLEVMTEVLGEDHPDTLTLMNNLAVLYHSQGKYAEAEPLYVKCVEVTTAVLGNKHPNTLALMNNLEAFYIRQGKGKYAGRAVVCEVPKSDDRSIGS